ncbi:hypothetical protein BB561_000215 [Smittium simulii]|uniref:Pentacotripeptide-repeat region of PRORP domain-containing protein n=1 Tax=Smittium simulii TaxID=133385 RepID=A0A2T9Z036_9FUNG|nr:hypothetical protein BB561_000215 [Smittium simulii]
MTLIKLITALEINTTQPWTFAKLFKNHKNFFQNNCTFDPNPGIQSLSYSKDIATNNISHTILKNTTALQTDFTRKIRFCNFKALKVCSYTTTRPFQEQKFLNTPTPLITSEYSLTEFWNTFEITKETSSFPILSKEGYINLVKYILEFGTVSHWCSDVYLLLNSFRKNYGYYIEENPQTDNSELSKLFLSTVLEIFAKYGDVRKAEELFKELRNGQYIRGNSSSKQNLISMVIAYAKNGNLPVAHKYLNQCQNAQTNYLSRAYVALIKAYLIEKQYYIAERYLEKIADFYCSSNSNFGIKRIISKVVHANYNFELQDQIKIQFLRGYYCYLFFLAFDTKIPISKVEFSFEKFLRIYQAPVAHRFYSIVVDACLLRNLKEKANDYIYQMSLNGISPDIRNYNSWIKYYVDNSLWGDIKKITSILDELKIQKNNVTFLHLMYAENKKNNLWIVKYYFWEYVQSVSDTSSSDAKKYYCVKIFSFILQFAVKDFNYWRKEIYFIVEAANQFLVKRSIVIYSLLSQIPKIQHRLTFDLVIPSFVKTLEYLTNKLFLSSEKKYSSLNNVLIQNYKLELNKNKISILDKNLHELFLGLPQDKKIQFWNEFSLILNKKSQKSQFKAHHILVNLLIYLISTKRYNISFVLYSCAIQYSSYNIVNFSNLQYSLLHAYLEQKNYLLARDILKLIVDSPKPSYGYPLSNVLNNHLKPGDYSYEVPYLSENALIVNFFKPCIKVYTILLKHAANDYNLSQVKLIWSLVIKSNLSLDTKIYLNSIKAHSLCGDNLSVLGFYNDMVKLNIKPSAVILNFVIKAAYMCAKRNDIINIIHTAIFKYKIFVSTISFNYLIKTIFLYSPTFTTLQLLNSLLNIMINTGNPIDKNSQKIFFPLKTCNKPKNYQLNDENGHLIDKLEDQNTSIFKTTPLENVLFQSSSSNYNKEAYGSHSPGIKRKLIITFKAIVRQLNKNKSISKKTNSNIGNESILHSSYCYNRDDRGNTKKYIKENLVLAQPPNLQTFTLFTKYALIVKNYNLVIYFYKLFENYKPDRVWERKVNPRILGNALYSYIKLGKHAEAKCVWNRMLANDFIENQKSDFDLHHKDFLNLHYKWLI